MASVSFYTGPGQNAFTTATRVGDYEIAYPMGEGAPSAIVIRARYQQTRADYSRPAVGTTLTYNAATAYFINDEGFRDLRNSVVEWTRVWATVPSSWSEPEEYAFTYPAITGAAFGTPGNLTAIAVNGSSYDITTNVASVATNDIVFVQANYTRNSLAYTMTFYATVTGTGAGTITIGGGYFPDTGAFSSVSGSVTEASAGRSLQLTATVGSRLFNEYTYAETPATLNSNLPLLQPFSPVDGSGIQTTTLSTGTKPTGAVYVALITGGGELVAECTRRRYMGNIYVRTTRFIPAL